MICPRSYTFKRLGDFNVILSSPKVKTLKIHPAAMQPYLKVIVPKGYLELQSPNMANPERTGDLFSLGGIGDAW